MMKTKIAMFLKQPSFRAAAAAGLVAVAGVAKADPAATFDTSAIVSTLTAAGTACAAVGIAYLTVVVGIKTYKLIRTAL